MTSINLNDGTVVYFSYNTPVAAFISGEGFASTEEKISSTTSRHVTKFKGDLSPFVTHTKKPQSFFDNLIA